jgi:hypothetical protein
MHDWTLNRLTVDWEAGEVEVSLDMWQGPRLIRALGLKHLRVGREFPWGPSVSVNGVVGPTAVEDGHLLLIEMQSGDPIEIVASSFQMPQDELV